MALSEKGIETVRAPSQPAQWVGNADPGNGAPATDADRLWSNASTETVPEATGVLPVTPSSAGPGVGPGPVAPLGPGLGGRRGVGFLLFVGGAWGALAPFVGPLFGFRPDGPDTWHVTMVRALLSVVPGVLAALGGLALFGGRRTSRFGPFTGAVLALVAGAWFVIGTIAWPVVHGPLGLGSYGVTASASGWLIDQVGAFAGLGLLICALAGVGMAESAHRRS